MGYWKIDCVSVSTNRNRALASSYTDKYLESPDFVCTDDEGTRFHGGPDHARGILISPGLQVEKLPQLESIEYWKIYHVSDAEPPFQVEKL